jgi:crossover junction endodeoxyribonuclease RuvC
MITLTAQRGMPAKLEKIYTGITSVLQQWLPEEFAIETAFYGKNVQSALKIGYARGAAIIASVHNNVPVSEYAPREIKKAVVGNGAASKEQVAFMAGKLLNQEFGSKKTDETDALGIALCHAFRFTSPAASTRDWKSFIAANPKRVIQ